MTTVRRSLVFSFLERYLMIALQIVSFTVLARLLTPQQIGLYSVTLAIVSIAQVIRDFGLANYLIQKKELSDDYVGSAVGVSLLLAGSLFVLVMIAAPFIGDYYKDASLSQIIHVVALNFLILPVNSICLALMRREMKFNVLMRINVVAAAVATGTTIWLAWVGFGSLALACGEITSNIMIALGLWRCGGMKVLVKPQLHKWREILNFGGQVTAANVVTSISMDINDLIVGKVLGFTPVAIISRAQGLVSLFNRDFMGAIRTVAYPAFSKAHREGESIETKYIASVTAITALAWPFYGLVSLFSLEILRIMFGPQWDQAAPLVPYFCLAGAFAATINMITTLMLSVGNSRLVALADFIIQPIKAIALTLVVYYYRALEPFAIGFLIFSILAVPYFYYFKERCIPSDFKGLVIGLSKSLTLTIFCLAPSVLGVQMLRAPDSVLPLLPLLICVASSGLVWLISIYLFKNPLYLEMRSMMFKGTVAKPTLST
jgi:lipopolysaccharide exporter